MIGAEFPIRHGFQYNEDYDEWYKPHMNGNIILWEKRGKWEMSYVDEEDYQKIIARGSEEEIIESFKIFRRDTRIGDILGE